MFAAFPKPRRFLAEEQVLLVHERRMESSIALNGPMKSCIQIFREKPALLETPNGSRNSSTAARSAPTSFFSGRRKTLTSTPGRRSNWGL